MYGTTLLFSHFVRAQQKDSAKMSMDTLLIMPVVMLARNIDFENEQNMLMARCIFSFLLGEKVSFHWIHRKLAVVNSLMLLRRIRQDSSMLVLPPSFPHTLPFLLKIPLVFFWCNGYLKFIAHNLSWEYCGWRSRFLSLNFPLSSFCRLSSFHAGSFLELASS